MDHLTENNNIKKTVDSNVVIELNNSCFVIDQFPFFYTHYTRITFTVVKLQKKPQPLFKVL